MWKIWIPIQTRWQKVMKRLACFFGSIENNSRSSQVSSKANSLARYLRALVNDAEIADRRRPLSAICQENQPRTTLKTIRRISLGWCAGFTRDEVALDATMIPRATMTVKKMTLSNTQSPAMSKLQNSFKPNPMQEAPTVVTQMMSTPFRLQMRMC